MSHGVRGTCVNDRWSGNPRREGLPCGGTAGRREGRDNPPGGTAQCRLDDGGLQNGFLWFWILSQKNRRTACNTAKSISSLSPAGIYQTQTRFQHVFLSVLGHTVRTSVTSVCQTLKMDTSVMPAVLHLLD